MTATLRFISLLALALWLGGMVFFSAIVAPTAFSILPNRVLAGDMVGGSLAGLSVLSYGCACVLLLCYVGRAFCDPPKRLVIIKAVIAGAALVISLYSAQVVTPPMAALRAQVHGIENLSASDPKKQEFDHLHHLAVDLMGLEMLGILGLFALEHFSQTRKPPGA